MYIKLVNQHLFWEMREVVDNREAGEEVDFTEINQRVEELLHGAESCQEMIENRKNISDEDFYKMLQEFAYISGWDDYDRYNVLEMAYNTKFVGHDTIKTTMHATIQKTEGHGRSFDYWDEKVGINYVILYTKDFEVDHEHFYTIEEIKKLIEEKKILLVTEEDRNLVWEEGNYEKQDYQGFDYAYDDYNMKHKFFSETGDFYKYTLKYIKKMINKKQLKKQYSEYLNHVEFELYEATDGRYHSSSWAQTAEEYSKEFKKLGYAKRLKKLKKANNN